MLKGSDTDQNKHVCERQGEERLRCLRGNAQYSVLSHKAAIFSALVYS